ncbi:hypothetical protein ACA910_003331 [Epithemia clementina (nom. ined.)]
MHYPFSSVFLGHPLGEAGGRRFLLDRGIQLLQPTVQPLPLPVSPTENDDEEEEDVTRTTASAKQSEAQQPCQQEHEQQEQQEQREPAMEVDNDEDEDDSDSSTSLRMTTRTLTINACSDEPQRKRQQQRRVRFALHTTCYAPTTQQHAWVDRTDLWYHDADYQFFRQQRDSTIRRLRQADEQLQQREQEQQQQQQRSTHYSPYNTNHNHKNKNNKYNHNNIVSQYATIVEAVYDECCHYVMQQQQQQKQQRLSNWNLDFNHCPQQPQQGEREDDSCFQWLLPNFNLNNFHHHNHHHHHTNKTTTNHQNHNQHSDSWRWLLLQQQFHDCIRPTACERLGLERSLVPRLAQDRRYRRTELVETVLDLQMTIEDDLPVHDKQVLLQQASQSISRPSRLFATQLALALQAQAQGEETLQEPEPQPPSLQPPPR